MKPWLPALLATSVALAGGAEGPALPTLHLDARTVGRTARVQTVPAVVYPDDAPYFQMFPSHVRAVLNLPGQRWRAQYAADVPPASVAVYPVSGWLSLYRAPGAAQEVGQRIGALRALSAGTLRSGDMKGALPFLPLRNAVQVTAGAVRRVETPALRGIRYLTVYSQEGGVPFPREAIFYTFQGLSRDGRFYISVQVPYAPASLPNRDELDRTRSYVVAQYSGPVDGAAQDAYRADLTLKLNAEDNAPDVRNLDALVRSIRLR